ncbi:uncharacterized protein LOC134532156 isoform X2 [Bacillus rossius redtenbacheri]|uniref:uncharacterized protein LOC134532156 isoform X2 n=1 Tax=Bacillus rossius redtenbacheri TaxID=93214 RepID=UPI002FDDD507
MATLSLEYDTTQHLCTTDSENNTTNKQEALINQLLDEVSSLREIINVLQSELKSLSLKQKDTVTTSLNAGSTWTQVVQKRKSGKSTSPRDFSIPVYNKFDVLNERKGEAVEHVNTRKKQRKSGSTVILADSHGRGIAGELCISMPEKGGTWSDACEPPLFCAVTWRADAPLPAHLPGVPALRLGAALAQRGPVLLHLAGAGLAEEDARRVLRHALTHNITSVLLLQGDTGGRPQRGSFPHAVDLVRFVRREFGQRFSVFVAGHPGGHPEAASYQDDLRHLRDKVDAGADGIISQVVFEAHKFAAFVRDCRHVGIFVPILPGIMLILR